MSTLATPAVLFDAIAIILMIVGVVAVVASLFQPLLKGMLRAALLMLQGKPTPANVHQINDAKALRQLADSVDNLEPNFAAELRAIAARA